MASATVENLIKISREKRLTKPVDAALIQKAFSFSKSAHQGQKRKSGEEYFNHSYQTALQLAEWGLDSNTISAGLLHDVAEDTVNTLDDIKNSFGEEIVFLVNGVTKLGRLKYRGTQRQVENLRKMFLAISEDLRVVLIKLADRLHNMKTLGAVPLQKQKRIALETDEIYAPLAYRLGMQNLAGELEDLSFPYLHPQEYKWLSENVKEKYEERLKYLEKVKIVVNDLLKKINISPAGIDFRAKRYSSLYKKLIRHEMNLEQIYDLVAFRIIVSSIEECYATLGAIHQMWPPLPGKIKDYIALPKPNGYRSLHTTVFCVDNKIVEFQIRTKEMHDEAENGIAAHWAYHDAKEKNVEEKPVFANRKELEWVNQLKNWQEEFLNSGESLEALKIDFFKDRIFAITPKGEVIDLPAGSTPVDFAYSIHSQIGDNCVGAKINNRIVPLDYQIQSGDMVEILIQKNKKPSESWIRFVKTDIAKKRIRSSLKKDHLPGSRERLQTEIKIIAEDRIGLLKDITSIVSRSHINISNVLTAPTSPVLTSIKFRCDTNNKDKVEKVILKLKKIKEIKQIGSKLI
ncbi:MAG: RelA/SpoT family protein [Patescibacteria group bacterium]